MVYDLRSRLDLLGDRMKVLNPLSATYTRGLDSVSLTVSPLCSMTDEMVPGIIIHEFQQHDWAFDAADLILDGQQTLPKTGDVLTVQGSSYRACPQMIPGQAPGSCYDYVTSSRKRIRLHTEEIP